MVHPPAVRLAIRRDYVAGLGTIAQIAQKHGVPVPTVEDWASHGQWSEARRRAERNANALMEGPAPAPEPPPPAVIDSEGSRTRLDVETIEEHLKACDDRLRLAKTADEWHKLTTARQRLFDQWCRLTALPREGVRRPERAKKRTVVDVEPLA
jgi:transposase-like protein